MEGKTALLIGATGLTGSHLLRLLLKDSHFGKIRVFVRRSTGISDPKLEEHIIDFNSSGSWDQLVTGDVLFSALGTTLRQAGGKGPQYRVDYTYQYEFAKASANNGVPSFVLVSSVGASPDSLIFYSKMKGELERDIKKLPFRSVHIFQPGPLEGPREKERMKENAGIRLIRFLNRLGLMKGYRPVHGEIVAKAMLNAALDDTEGIHVYRLLEVFEKAGISL